MASGLPVISSPIGGIAEIVENAQTGYLVEPGNIVELKERLTTLISDPQLRRRMGNAGRERVRAQFDKDRNYSRLLAVICEAAQNARSSVQFA